MPKTRVNDVLKKALAPGTKVAGKYRIVEMLGQGNFAYVMRARHDLMERDVALKVLKPEMVDASPDVSERFLTEVRIVSRLHHPNTVTVYDFGETPEGLLYMVLEFVDGIGLEQALKAGAIAQARANHICKQVLKSLDEAHSVGIVHRDLKPSNVMLTNVHGESDFVKVLDFGVAKLISDSERKTRVGNSERRSTQFIGTPIYMSPEQVLGREVVPASDVYSLGLILYEMLTGDPPVDMTLNVAAVAQLHIDDAPLPFGQWSMVPRGYRDLIRKATSRQPENRFPTVREFARALPDEALNDMTGEFRRLVEEEVDVFSGKGYVDFPDSESYEDPAPRAHNRSRNVDRQMLASRSTGRKRSQAELQLDVGKLKREQLTRRREERTEEVNRSEMPESSELLRQLGFGAIGLATFWFAFVLLTCLSGPPTGQRLAVFAAHVVGAVLWTEFSTVTSLNNRLTARWLVPLMQHGAYLLAIEVVLVALVMSDYAVSAMQNSATWPAQAMGLSSNSFVGAVVGSSAGILQSIFEITSSLIPW